MRKQSEGKCFSIERPPACTSPFLFCPTWEGRFGCTALIKSQLIKDKKLQPNSRCSFKGVINLDLTFTLQMSTNVVFLVAVLSRCVDVPPPPPPHRWTDGLSRDGWKGWRDRKRGGRTHLRHAVYRRVRLTGEAGWWGDWQGWQRWHF